MTGHRTNARHRRQPATIGRLCTVAMALFGCDPTMANHSDGALESGLDASADSAIDGSFREQCSWGSGVAWRSTTRVAERSAGGECPSVVRVDGYAGDLDCGEFDACCDFPAACRFRVELTFHDDRPQPCTGAVPCLPPHLDQRLDCRCERGAIRCPIVANAFFPYHFCSDCYLPQVCDGGRD